MPNNRNYSRDKKFARRSHSDKNRTLDEQENAKDGVVRNTCRNKNVFAANYIPFRLLSNTEFTQSCTKYNKQKRSQLCNMLNEKL
ncbi:MAG: hypothetical protein LBM87_07235 [Ruminococcus sp.]|jgi:hypothetical protein|nr:hypothetical protein [Ruminococcus sp.]